MVVCSPDPVRKPGSCVPAAGVDSEGGAVVIGSVAGTLDAGALAVSVVVEGVVAGAGGADVASGAGALVEAAAAEVEGAGTVGAVFGYRYIDDQRGDEGKHSHGNIPPTEN